MELENFVLPQRVERNPKTYSSNYGEFLIQPLERGYGVTLGNALRRVLLSSVEGTAIWGIKIKDVLHEFSTIPGVVEDTTEVVMNLKKLILKLDSDVEEEILKLSTTKSGPVTAGQVELPPSVELLNPELHLFTLTEDQPVRMEIRIRRGRGYVPVEQRSEKDIGYIPIDAVFSPVRKVNFLVENTRVGQRTDYDKLILQVTTNGTITPEEAVTASARILLKHFEYFLAFREPSDESGLSIDARREQLKEILSRGVDELELSVRSSNCLRVSNIKTLGDLVQKTEPEMLKFRNFGKKSLNEISEILLRYGLRFGMRVRQNEKGEYEILDDLSEKTPPAPVEKVEKVPSKKKA